MRTILVLSVSAVLLALVPTVASAQSGTTSGTCITLQQQYLAATRGSTPVPGAAQVAALRASLATAEVAVSTNHCRSLGIFQPAPTSACPAVMQQVDRLQASLRDAPGFSSSVGFFSFAATLPRSPADQLRDSLTVNGCALPDAAGYRPLCVRTCDGYYFPVSPSSGSGGATADEMTCQATYGAGTKAEIFVASLSGDVADAVSTSGRRYGDQPYAFSYRTNFNAVCVAQLQDGVAALGARAPIAATTATLGVVATATAKPPAAAVATPLPMLATSGGSSPVMRVVGAAYYNIMLQQQDGAVAPSSLAAAPR